MSRTGTGCRAGAYFGNERGFDPAFSPDTDIFTASVPWRANSRPAGYRYLSLHRIPGGKAGAFVRLSDEMEAYIRDEMEALVGPDDVYLQALVTTDGKRFRLFARYNRIIGSRCLIDADAQ